MSAFWIILILVAFLAAFVALIEMLCHGIRDSLDRECERTEQEQRRREFIQAAVVRKRKW